MGLSDAMRGGLRDELKDGMRDQTRDRLREKIPNYLSFEFGLRVELNFEFA